MAVAIEALSWIELEKLSAKGAFQKAARQLQVSDRETLGMAYRQVFETMRRLNLLDRVAEEAVGRDKYAGLPLGVRAFLRILVHESAVGQRRHINALKYVKAAREILGWNTLHPVEQHLGKILNTEATSVLRGLPEVERTALRLYAPEWLVIYASRLLGRAEALAFLRSLSTSPPTYVRLNSLKQTPQSVSERLGQAGFDLTEVASIRGLYRLSRGELPVTGTEVFKEGLVSTEDLPTAYAVENSGVTEDALVLDICAAPGVKTAHMAQLMDNKGVICSVELSRQRAGVWKDEMRRMGVRNAIVVVADATEAMPSDAEFDIVVVDPPCSRIGTWARDPNAKWMSSPEAVSRYASTQWKILESSAGRVRRSGVLLYSTRTITVEENEVNIQRLLRYYPGFTLAELKPDLGSHGLRGLTMCRRLYPHRDNCYGSFIAKLVRKD